MKEMTPSCHGHPRPSHLWLLLCLPSDPAPAAAPDLSMPQTPFTWSCHYLTCPMRVDAPPFPAVVEFISLLQLAFLCTVHELSLLQEFTYIFLQRMTAKHKEAFNKGPLMTAAMWLKSLKSDDGTQSPGWPTPATDGWFRVGAGSSSYLGRGSSEGFHTNVAALEIHFP